MLDPWILSKGEDQSHGVKGGEEEEFTGLDKKHLLAIYQ